MHSQKSGRRLSHETLRDALVRQGHELVRIVVDRTQALQLADHPAELVVAAGGDGTVSAAARAIVGRDVPLAVLPLGTANNFAFSIGAVGSIDDLARRWHAAPRRPLDLGVVRGAWGTQHFIEGVGGGLVAAAIASMTARPGPRGEPAPWQLKRALRRYADILSRQRARRWELTVDGRPRTGDYLLVEILNARAVGPNLDLAPGASVSDGTLTLVTVGEGDRGALAACIADLGAGRDARLSLPTEEVRCVELRGSYQMHLDDELVSDPLGGGLSIGIEPGALTFLDTQA
jgi:diacylglycerol kinase family enzyme